MAFNPFRAFRKHQKVVMAGMVMVAMLTFVVAGSSGYFLELTGWFRGGGNSPQVAVLYGKPVSTQDIVQVRLQRELANAFIVTAISETNTATCNKLSADVHKSKLSKQNQQAFDRLLTDRTFAFLTPQLGGTKKDTLDAILRVYQQAQNMTFLFSQEEAGEASFIQQFLHVLEQDYQLLSRSGQFYFGGSPDSEDLLDFMIWQRQADRLGIQLSESNIGALLGKETQGRFTPDVNKKVQQSLRATRYRDLQRETLNRALAAEFRARLAQDAVLGAPVSTFDQYLPSLTPYDFWTYYRDQRAESTVAMLPIPVAHEDFLGKVGEPTAEDLKSLYDKGKDRKYNPANPGAGFKQPTRVLLEWATADPDSPHYKRAAEVAVAATQASLPIAYEMALRDEYDRQKGYFFSPSWTNDYLRALHASSVNRPSNVAAAVGQALGAGATQGPAALSGWMTYQGSAVHHEVQDRLRHERKMILAWMGGSPWVTAALAYEALPKSEFLPLEDVKPFVLDKLKETVAKKLASNALEEVQKDLRDLRSHYSEFPSARQDLDEKRMAVGLMFGHAMGPAGPLGAAGLMYQQQVELARVRGRAASAFVLGNTSRSAPLSAAALVYRDQSQVVEELRKRAEENIAKYALKHGRAERMADQHEVGNDPGLAPLKAAVEKSWDFGQEARTKSFGDRVLPLVERGNVYDPHQVRDTLTSTDFVYWKTKDQMEYVPPFDEVKEKVAKRWKLEKARELARKEAEEIVKALPKGTTGPDVERALRDAKRADLPNEKTHGGSLFELERVARLVPARVAMESRTPMGSYEPYKIPQLRVEYPSPEMVQKILALKEPGEAVVLHDQPETTYYVAALVHRAPAYEIAFAHDAAQPETFRTLLTSIEQDTKYREKQRQGYLDQLRSEALRDVNKENLKKASATREEE
jgi:hypothetical protein